MDRSFASNYFEMTMVNNAIFGKIKGLNEFNDGNVSGKTENFKLWFLLHCVTV